jgi:hypothetical protein
MTKTQEARAEHTVAFVKSVREGDGWPVEADTDLNDSCRRVIEAMAEDHGECWLGSINLYGADRHGAKPYMWKWDGSLVRNFSCAFVVPGYDAELERLIRERDDAPYTGVAADAVRVAAIMDRIAAVGGTHLFWT